VNNNLLTLCLSLLLTSIAAQPNLGSISGVDSLYDPLVHSAHFNDGSNTVALPLFIIDQKERYFFEFDLLEGSPRRLYYTFRYYDRNWNESPVDILEIVDGLNELEINQFQTSFNTYTPYVHYNLSLLPRALNFRQSGNYLLVVYDQESNIYLTRKIYITTPLFTSTINFIQPTDPRKISTHQSLSVVINSANYNVIDVKKEVQLEVIQNGNTENRIILNEPLFFSGNNLRFTKVDAIQFPAGKEFHSVDIRSIQRKGPGVRYWDEEKGEFHCYAYTDVMRREKNYLLTFDYNGKIAYTSSDVPLEFARTRSEYVYLHLSLASPEKLDKDVYVFGQISDWKIKDEFKMTYDPATKMYKTKVYVKNAWVDYAYVTLDDHLKADLSEIDGDWSDAENDYFILCYYRPFGGRFDNLMLGNKINSNRN